MAVKQKTYNVVVINQNVFFPHSKYTLEISGESIKEVEKAIAENSDIIVVTRLETKKKDEGSFIDLNKVGTVCTIKSFIQNGKKNAKLSLEGLRRAVIKKMTQTDGFCVANVCEQTDKKCDQMPPARNSALKLFRDIAKIDIRQSAAVTKMVEKLLLEPDILCDTLSSICINCMDDRLDLLNELDLNKRYEILCEKLKKEWELILLTKKLAKKTQENISKHQKEFFLREQMRVIGEELGDDMNEQAELLEKLESSGAPADVIAKCKKEIGRLSKMSPMSPELAITRAYVENLLELPWKKTNCEAPGLKRAREILDADHYGMEEVKQRIIEHIAVMQLNPALPGQILCFVGPPGVGKTSIAESLARALGRSFVRVSLGGIRDEAEIRGHRKTYVGAMPGKILNGMKKAGTINPVFLLDEIDKMSHDTKGDPASACLEVLDPVQNKVFVDHYLEIPYDLSQVLFICTANDEESIPWALHDRMEIIQLSSYTLVEKIKIAGEFLFPKCIAEHGLEKSQICIDESEIAFIADHYTREAGVRELQRVISNLCRKIAVRIVNNEMKANEAVILTQELIVELLGKEKFSKDDNEKKDAVGVVNGLSYTSVGGDLLKLEVVLTPGKGELKLTGNLGNVMKESAQIALSITKHIAGQYGIKPEAFKKNDVHIHVPGGAVPKDGPSAGSALVVALVSAFSGRAVNGNFALTGEITLSGKVLEIGGVREKVLGAYRYGIDNVVMPIQNRKSLEKVPAEVTKKLNFVFASSITEVLSSMLI